MQILDDADPTTLRRLRILLTEGNLAFERVVVLELHPGRRLTLLATPSGRALVLGAFPEGLPDSWLQEVADACWARWFAGQTDGR